MQKRKCKSMEVQAEMKCGSGTSHLWKSWQNKVRKAELQIFASQGRAKVRKQNFTFLAVSTERKCGRGTSDLGSKDRAEAELQIFGSQGRAEVRKKNIRSLQSRQSRSVETKFQIFSRQDRAEVWKQHCRPLTVQSSWTCGSRS